MTADITSPSNERIKWLVRLRERRHRDEEGVFLVEGQRLYRRALGAGLSPLITFVRADCDVGPVGEAVTVAPGALDKASYRQRSQELIAVFPQRETRLASLALPPRALVLIVEDIEKPGNLGAMLRTAAAAGADALIAIGKDVDFHNPNVVRSSTGSLFSMAVAQSEWGALAPWLAEREVDVVCASPEAGASLWDADLTGPIALVVGAEDVGLSSHARQVAKLSVSIPQAKDSVDSLNVSVAAAIVLFEASRQRQAANPL